MDHILSRLEALERRCREAEAKTARLAEAETLLSEHVQRATEDGSATFELVCHRRDGSAFPLQVFARRVEQQDPAAVPAISADFAERNPTQDELRKSEEKYRLLVETTLDFILMHDLEGRVIFANRVFFESTGYSASDIVGKSLTDFVPVERLAEVYARGRRRVAGDVHLFCYETMLVNKNGSLTTVEVNSSPVVSSGKTIGILLVARDITGRKKAEAEKERLEQQLRQAQRMEAVGHLAGGIAHDFNNLLQIILVNVDLVQSALGPEGAHAEMIEDVRKAAERAADLTRQLLAFSRRQVMQGDGVQGVSAHRRNARGRGE